MIITSTSAYEHCYWVAYLPARAPDHCVQLLLTLPYLCWEC